MGLPAAASPELAKGDSNAVSTCLPSPFDAEVLLDDDASFAVRVMFVFGPHVRVWRRQQRRAVCLLARWLQPRELVLRQVNVH